MDQQGGRRPRIPEELTYLRKIKKPLVERKRRERINTSLQQLKQLLLENIKMNGGTQVSKLDKADILELTVSYLRHIQQQQKLVSMVTSTSSKSEYTSGYREATYQSVSYLNRETTLSSNGYHASHDTARRNLNEILKSEVIPNKRTHNANENIPKSRSTEIECENSISAHASHAISGIDTNGNVTYSSAHQMSYNAKDMYNKNHSISDDGPLNLVCDKVTYAARDMHGHAGTSNSVYSNNNLFDFNGNIATQTHFIDNSTSANVDKTLNIDEGDSDIEQNAQINCVTNQVNEADNAAQRHARQRDNAAQRHARQREDDNAFVQRENVWRPW